MINRLTILSFGLNIPLQWHGWMMKLGFTSLLWSCDEVGVVLRWWFQNTVRWGQLNKSQKQVYPKMRARSEKVSTKGITSTTRQLLRNLNTRSYVHMYLSFYVHGCSELVLRNMDTHSNVRYKIRSSANSTAIVSQNPQIWNFLTPQLASGKMTAVEDGYTHSCVRMCSKFVCGTWVPIQA